MREIDYIEEMARTIAEAYETLRNYSVNGRIDEKRVERALGQIAAAHNKYVTETGNDDYIV